MPVLFVDTTRAEKCVLEPLEPTRSNFVLATSHSVSILWLIQGEVYKNMTKRWRSAKHSTNKKAGLANLFRGRLAFGIAALLLTVCLPLRAQVTTDTSGFLTLHIRGTGGTTSSALSFIGLSLTRPVEFQGNFEAIGVNTLTDDNANWIDNQFNGANGKYYLEITSGDYAGVMTDIVDTTGATKTLTIADNYQGLLTGGETYKIRKHWTLASILGAANQAGLGGGTIVTADEILIYVPTSATYTIYYYKTTAAFGGVGWRSFASPSVDESNAKIDLAKGIIVKRKQSNDLDVKLFGAVKMGDTAINVKTGLNVLGNVYSTDTLTLGNCGLYTGDANNGLAGGTLVSADQVLIYDGSAYQIYYYKTTTTFGGTGWRSLTSPSLDASSTVIPSGSSILVKRIDGRPEFFWYAAQPF